ncbi:tetratricopeptide repeat protein [Leptospirillum ferriphilum]|jgi:predicted Zn-dependent protease|uniref:tetratricopeptide repeat protein n=1 Tax=Leptospirillum ferriphilum TaxID=178606 RepID=UPI0006B19158|nr:hypothetical protein [Leptospirillum ferriphilum]OOH83780.1 hypothetical protein BOX30_02265 [Leptospirillum ferriphilum]
MITFPENFSCKKALQVLMAGVYLFWMTGCASSGGSGSTEASLTESFEQDLRTGHYLKARQDLSRELRLHPRNISVWNNLAYLDFKNGQYRQADGDLAQGLALNPKNAFLLENRARLFLARHKDKAARKILLSLETVRPWPRGFRLLLAIADLRTGHQEEARLLLNAILSDRPRDPLARVYLSRLGNGGVRG